MAQLVDAASSRSRTRSRRGPRCASRAPCARPSSSGSATSARPGRAGRRGGRGSAAAGTAAAGAAVSRRGRRRRPAAAGVGRPSMWPRMSCFVTRPPIPVPGISRMSSWCSAAILRTTGDERVWRSSSAHLGAPSRRSGLALTLDVVLDGRGGGRGPARRRRGRRSADGRQREATGRRRGERPGASGRPRASPGGAGARRQRDRPGRRPRRAVRSRGQRRRRERRARWSRRARHSPSRHPRPRSRRPRC